MIGYCEKGHYKIRFDSLKRLFIQLIFLLLISQAAYTAGALFNIIATGVPDNINITLCLNGEGPVSCQNFNVAALDLKITTTIPNHVYSLAGIRINTPNRIVTRSGLDCTPAANGFCLFTVSDRSSKTMSLYPSIGTAYQGGFVACEQGAPYMNLIAASSDSIDGIPWGGFSLLTGAQSSIDGARNTRAISAAGVTNSAINLCLGTINGYNDWFLPAKEQLNCLYQHQAVLPGFMNGTYWSSTESDDNNAVFQFFDNGNELSVFKTFYNSVRCVRIATA